MSLTKIRQSKKKRKIYKPKNKPVISCQEAGCAKKFVSKQTHLWHLQKAHGHDGNESYLGDELITVGPSGKFKCPLCPSELKDKASLRYHIKNTHEGLRSTCELCGMSLSLKGVKSHMANRHSEETFFCDQCDYSTANPHAFSYHKASRHDPTKHICEECGKSFSHKMILATHVKDKHTDKIYRCDQCDFSCKGQTQQLKHHILTRHSVANFICSLCDFVTSSDVELETHKSIMHKEKELFISPKKGREKRRREREALNDYTCSVCNIKKKSRQVLAQHIKAEHEGIRYSCPEEECNYSSKQKGTLKVHIDVVHRGIKHECEKCDFKAGQITNLRLHMMKKHGLQPFTCDQCAFRCYSSDKMKNHMQVQH